MKLLGLLCWGFFAFSLAAAPETVRVSDFGFDAADATRFVRQALATGAKRIVFDRREAPWKLKPLSLRDDLELVFEKEVTVIALPESGKRFTAPLFRGDGVSRVTLRGEPGATLAMLPDLAPDAKKNRVEPNAHLIAFFSGRDITVQGLTLRGAAADGIFLGVKKGYKPNYNARIRLSHLTLQGCRRSGIHSVSADHLTIEKCLFRHTAIQPQPVGIHFAPGPATGRCQAIEVAGCHFLESAETGIRVEPGCRNAIGITLRDNLFEQGASGVVFDKTRQGQTPGRVTVEQCRFEEMQCDPIQIRDHDSASYAIRFRHCEINHSAAAPELAAVAFAAVRSEERLFGNAGFSDVKVSGYRRLLRFKRFLPEARLDAVAGEINGIPLADWIAEQGYDKAEYRAFLSCPPNRLAAPEAPVPPRRNSPVLQGQITLILHIGVSGRAQFDLACGGAMPKYGIPLALTDAEGKSVLKLEPLTAARRNRSFDLALPGPGVYQLQFDTSRAVAQFRPGADMRWAIQGLGNEAVTLAKPENGQTLFFEVPSGVRQFGVQIAGGDGAFADAALCDGEGREVQRLRHFDAPVLFTANRRETPREIWRLVIHCADGPVRILLPPPLPPFLADAPENLFRIVQ